MFKKTTFNLKDFNPVQQGLFCAVLVTLISICCLILHVKSMQAWNMILSPIFLFCFYNPIIGVIKQKPIQYTAISFVILILLLGYIYISGNFVSDYSYQQSRELHLIAALSFVFYFLMQTLCVVFRIILYLLNEADK